TPNAKTVNGKDTGTYDAASATLTFQDGGNPWYGLISATMPPTSGAASDTLWGPVPPAAQPDYLENGNGTGAELKWKMTLAAGKDLRLWIGAAGPQPSQAEPQKALQAALTGPDKLLSDKIAARKTLLDQTKVDLPDKPLQAAFDWGKLNMADLRRTVKDV